MTYYNVAPVRFGVGVSGSTTTQGVNDPEIGTRCVVDEVEYLFVYNAGGEQVLPGQPVILSAVTGYSVTVSSVTSVDFAIGVRLHSTLPTAGYGWVATRGIGVIEMGSNESCVTGNPLGIGTEGFCLASNMTGFQTPVCGKALESIASGGSGSAYFSLL